MANAECIKTAASKIIKASREGYQVVAIVSARAGVTDELIQMARAIVAEPAPRELDMLLSTGEQVSIALMCMTLHVMGQPAISLTGAQVGIVTDNAHTKAQLQSVETDVITRQLDRGKVVVVAGFQGVDPQLNITTLGRGTSDLTAVALAAALKADLCEIYTDVDGIYTADPNVVPTAVRLDAISHDELLELAGTGAGIVQSRSVELAKKFHVPLRVRSTFSESPGTVVACQVHGFEDVPVCGVAIDLNESRITISGVPDTRGVAAGLVGAIAERNINIDTIVQSFPHQGTADMSLVVKDRDLREALEACEAAASELGAGEVSWEEEIARVSAVGKGMVAHEGIAARMCTALGDEGINIKMITTSEISISVVVDSAAGERALRAVHKAFGLVHLPKATAVTDVPVGFEWSTSDAMEGFHVQSVECDRDQAEVKILGLSDIPGQAGLLLAALADAKVGVDVVLQNSCASGISVTIGRADVERATNAVQSMSPPVTRQAPRVNPRIAKVWMNSVGLRSYPGAAAKVFQVLADEQINIEMIGTSEAQLSVVVAESSADRAAAALRREFKLATSAQPLSDEQNG